MRPEHELTAPFSPGFHLCLPRPASVLVFPSAPWGLTLGQNPRGLVGIPNPLLLMWRGLSSSLPLCCGLTFIHRATEEPILSPAWFWASLQCRDGKHQIQSCWIMCPYVLVWTQIHQFVLDVKFVTLASFICIPHSHICTPWGAVGHPDWTPGAAGLRFSLSLAGPAAPGTPSASLPLSAFPPTFLSLPSLREYWKTFYLGCIGFRINLRAFSAGF